jgi:hypothetical protein
LPIGLANGVPLLNASGALASADAYLSRGSLTSAVDWDTLTNAGVYEVGSGAFGAGSANTPPAVTQQGHLLVFKTSGATTQVYVPVGGDPGIYWRQYAGGTWSSWATAGVMYSSNSNGSYIRFADGTQICWSTQPTSQWNLLTQYTSTVGSITVLTKDMIGVAFPAAFIAAPAVITSGDIVHKQLKSIMSHNVSQTGLNLTASYQADGAPITSHYIAIGRWK